MEGAGAREHLVKNRAKGEDVRSVVDRMAQHLFGRHVTGRSADLAGPALFDGRFVTSNRGLVLAQLGDAEVEKLEAPVLRNECVCRFDVAVPDSLCMRGIQRLRDLDTVLDGFAVRQRSLVQPSAQRFTLKELGNHVGDAAIGTDIENGDDVRVIEAAGGACLATESRDDALLRPKTGAGP